MEPERKQELLEAVSALITEPNAHDLYDTLRAIIPTALRHPIRLSDGAAVLNPLLKLRVADEAAYTRVLDLIERRRAELDYDPLEVPDGPSAYDKVAYMREFMEQKRQRQRVAADIENMLRPERDKLVGNHRLEFMRQQSLRWKLQLDEYLAKAKDAAGGKMTKEQLSKSRGLFWSAVDDELERRREAARIESLKPPHMRQPTATVEADLLRVLEQDPYELG